MNYLNIFDKATLWIKYIHSLNTKYYKDNFLEIGAGIGSFTDGYKTISNTRVMRRALNYAKSFDGLIIQHAEDPFLKGNGVIH